MKNNVWFSYINFAIKIKNLDFEIFELSSNPYKV